jgi:hypothetical protein
MTVDPSVEGFLSGGGAVSAKFPEPGATIKGTIEEAAVSQQTDLDGKPRVWDDGNPRQQLVVTLTTDERDSTIDDDNGARRVFIKGQMLTALKDALKKAGAKSIEVGGTLAIKYTGDGTPTKVGFNAPKLYVCQYKQPVSVITPDVDELL